MTIRRVIPRALAQRDIEAALDYYVYAAGVDVALRFVASLESPYRIVAERPAIGSPRFAYELGFPRMRHHPFILPMSEKIGRFITVGTPISASMSA